LASASSNLPSVLSVHYTSQGSQRITLLKFDMDISAMTSWRTFLYYELLQQKKRATKNDFKQGSVLYMVLSKIKHD